MLNSPLRLKKEDEKHRGYYASFLYEICTQRIHSAPSISACFRIEILYRGTKEQLSQLGTLNFST